VHVRISCPPLIDRCPYGVDFHRGELIASQYRDLSHPELCEKIRKELDATTLYYNTIPDLVRSIGLNRQELCIGCLTGIYPQIDWSQMDSEW
jgi:amidophosphoribosyltransferase